MRRFIVSMLLSFVMLVVAVSAFGQGGGASTGGYGNLESPMYPQGSILQLKKQVDLLASQMEQRQAETNAAITKLNSVKTRNKAGLCPQSEVNDAEVEVQRARTQLEAAAIKYRYARLLVDLAQPVDITLKSASVRQAVDALKKVTSADISVDDAVGNDVFVSTEAEGVPLAGVLEVIASSAGLMIEPSGSGVKLAKPAKFSVDGKVVKFEYPNWPWGDEWAFGGGYGGGGGAVAVGRKWLGLYQVDMSGSTGQRVSSGVPASIVLAGVGSSTLIVAEPAVGPQGEPGYWLTVYDVINDGRLDEQSHTFHRSAGSQPAPKSSGGGGGK